MVSRKRALTAVLRVALAILVLKGANPAVPTALAQEAPLFRLRGLVTARNEAMLSSQINAIIAEMPCRSGDRFQRGDVLVRFDCAVQKAQQQRAQAEVTATRRTLSIKRELLRLNTVSPLEVELAEAETAKAEADLAQANAITAMCMIKAPFAGRVVEIKAHPHESYSSGQPLMAIIAHDDLEAEIIVPSRWLSWLKPGATFVIRLEETGDSHRGEITKIGARIDQVSQTIKVFGMLRDSPEGLIPGMTGEVVFGGQP